jgi:hypothetical protein
MRRVNIDHSPQETALSFAVPTDIKFGDRRKGGRPKRFVAGVGAHPAAGSLLATAKLL